MHSFTFLLAVALLTLGAVGMIGSSSPDEIQANASPGLFFGGSILIASFYALREPRHGMAAASFLTFLAFLTNASTVLGELLRGSFEWLRIDHRHASLVMTLSAIYLGLSYRGWRRARGGHHFRGTGRNGVMTALFYTVINSCSLSASLASISLI